MGTSITPLFAFTSVAGIPLPLNRLPIIETVSATSALVGFATVEYCLPDHTHSTDSFSASSPDTTGIGCPAFSQDVISHGQYHRSVKAHRQSQCLNSCPQEWRPYVTAL